MTHSHSNRRRCWSSLVFWCVYGALVTNSTVSQAAAAISSRAPLNSSLAPSVRRPVKHSLVRSTPDVAAFGVRGSCSVESARECSRLQAAVCFGAQLPYTMTSHQLTVGSVGDEQTAHKELRRWQVLRSLPLCWSAIQPLLCSVYLPPCENGLIELPSKATCVAARQRCRLFDSLIEWPQFLNCSSRHFVSHCKSRLLSVRYRTTGGCVPPLVATNNTAAYLPHVAGCGEPCDDALVYSGGDAHSLHRFLHVFSGLSFALTLLAVLTYIIDWPTFGRHTANRCIFYINACLCACTAAVLAQFLDADGDSRRSAVCHRDHTRRTANSGESSGTCTAIFILLYYPSVAAMCWFVMLAFSWLYTLKQFGRSCGVREPVESLMSYYHLVSWSVPLVFTTAALATSDVVDGDYLYGICYISFTNWSYRVIFVLAPAIVSALFGSLLLLKSVVFLLRHRPPSGCPAGRRTLTVTVSAVRLAVCAVASLLAVIGTCVCHVLEYVARGGRTAHVASHVICLLNNTVHNQHQYQYSYHHYHNYHDYHYPNPYGDQSHSLMSTSPFIARGSGSVSASGSGSATVCQRLSAPSVVLMKSHMFCLFGVAVLFSSWLWRRATVRAWTKFYHRMTGRSDASVLTTAMHQRADTEAIAAGGRAVAKHRVIAQAWSKRHQLTHNRRISLSFPSVASDPVGILAGLQTPASQSPSSSFLAAVPSLLVRRGALIGSTSSALGLTPSRPPFISDAAAVAMRSTSVLDAQSVCSGGSVLSMMSRHSGMSLLSCDSQISTSDTWLQQRRRRHSLDSTRSLTIATAADTERLATLLFGGADACQQPHQPAMLPGLGISGGGGRRRFALAGLNRHHTRAPRITNHHRRRLSIGRRRASHASSSLSVGSRSGRQRAAMSGGQQPSVSRRSSTVSRASSSITSQLAHVMECMNGRAVPRLFPPLAPCRAALPATATTTTAGQENASYQHSSSEGAQHSNKMMHALPAAEQHARSPVSSTRTGSRVSVVSSTGSSILNLAQRLRGDICDFAQRSQQQRKQRRRQKYPPSSEKSVVVEMHKLDAASTNQLTALRQLTNQQSAGRSTHSDWSAVDQSYSSVAPVHEKLQRMRTSPSATAGDIENADPSVLLGLSGSVGGVNGVSRRSSSALSSKSSDIQVMV